MRGNENIERCAKIFKSCQDTLFSAMNITSKIYILYFLIIFFLYHIIFFYMLSFCADTKFA